jgi:hypothetical protein
LRVFVYGFAMRPRRRRKQPGWGPEATSSRRPGLARRRVQAALLAGVVFLGLGALPAIHEFRHDARTHVHDGDVVHYTGSSSAAEPDSDDSSDHHHGSTRASDDDEGELPEGSSGVDHPEPWHTHHGAHSALHGHMALLGAAPPPRLEPVEPLWDRPPAEYAAPLDVQRFRIPVVAQGPPSA